MSCPKASATTDAGCCVNKHTTFLWRRNYCIQDKPPGCPGKQEEYEKRKYFFSPLGEQKEDETPDQGSHRSKIWAWHYVQGMKQFNYRESSSNIKYF